MSDEKKILSLNGLTTLVNEIKTKYSLIGHKHTKSDITDFPTIPTKTSQLTNDSGYVKNTASAGTSLGLVKSGGDVTISGGVITVNDNSHNHTIINVEGLQSALDGKASSTHTHTVDTSLSSTSTNPVQNKIINSALAGKVPTSRTINGKALSSNITLSASDVGADASGSSATALNSAKAYTDGKIDSIVGEGASESLDTIGEISIALKGNKDIIDTLNAAIGNKANASDLTSHTGNKSNPHGVTLSQLGVTASSAELNKLKGVTATTTELNYVDGVTSNIQTQLNGKSASSHTHNYAGSSSAGGSATLAEKVKISDTRSVNSMPNDAAFDKNAVSYDFKQVTAIGTPTGFGGTYCALESIAPWGEQSGGAGYQIAYGYNGTDTTNPRLAIRSASLSASSWGGWNKIYTSADKPTLAELGAAASSHNHNASNINAGTLSSDRLPTVPISKGGTSATTAAAALTNLGISANSTEINVLDGITATTTELNYMDGVTSNVQTQLNGKSSTSHTHNTIAKKGDNTITSTTNDTTTNWGAQGNSIHWYTTAGQIKDQPSTYGYILNIGQGSEVHQLWMTQSSGNLAHRGGNGSGWNGTWRTVLDSSNYNNYVPTKTGTGASGTWGISVSGNAATATKLGTSNIGSATQPIYLNAGAPIACTYTLGKSVPSDAKFTDTVYTLPAAGSALGGVKSGGDVTISSGTITVNDDSHNHIISNIDGLQSALDVKSDNDHRHYAFNTDITGQDLNDYTDAGIYTFTAGSAPANRPPNNTNGWLVVIPWHQGNATIKQLWFRHGVVGTNDYETFVRTKVGTGAWGAWSKYYTSSNPPTAAEVGAISKDLQMVGDNGGCELSFYKADNKNVLTEIVALPLGMHTIYSQSGVTGNPKTTEAWRFLIHKNGTNICWVQGYGSLGSVYTNYYDGDAGWRGWKCIWDSSPAPLWSGAMYMSSPNSNPQTVTPSKKLSECRNGWLLLWSDYDPGVGANDADFVTTMIPKRNPTGGTWGGKSFLCDIPRWIGSDTDDVSTEKRIIKPIYVHDDCIKGSYQNDSGTRNDVVLRAVYEY